MDTFSLSDVCAECPPFVLLADDDDGSCDWQTFGTHQHTQ